MYSMYIPDLSPHPCRGGVREISSLLMVGWLGRSHSFPTGMIDTKYITKLEQIISSEQMVLKLRGRRFCELCDKSIDMEIEGKQYLLGTREIWIPTNTELIYVAPSLIYHFITEHHYLPPKEFLDALLNFVFPDEWKSDKVIVEEFTKRCNEAPDSE